MEKRYYALRVIGTIYKVLGICVAVLTVLVIVSIGVASRAGGALPWRDFDMPMRGGRIVGGLLMAVLSLLYGGVAGLTLYAFGEGVALLIALEENTRRTAELLQRSVPSEPPTT